MKKIISILIFAAIFTGCLKRPKNIMMSIDKDSYEGMAFIPGGEFIYGGDKEDKSIVFNKTSNILQDLHLASLPVQNMYVKPFYIDKYETTYSEYKRFVDIGAYNKREFWTDSEWEFKKGKNGYKKEIFHPLYWNDEGFNSGPNFPFHPVIGVSWYEASAYCRWLGKRLPTEAEWEKAARGTDGRIWPWGDNFKENNANTSESEFNETLPVGSFGDGVSPYGVHDMAGNVMEWVAETFYSDDREGFYFIYKEGEKKEDGILRSGAFPYNAIEAMTYSRTKRELFDQHRGRYTGIRCAKD